MLKNLVGIQGILFLIYTAGLVFILRQFCAGPLLRKITPIGVLIFASVFSAVGLYWLGHVKTAGVAFLAATVFGIGKAYFWPTMLGLAAERYPKGGALVLGILGAAGMFAAGYLTTPTMGRLQDHYAVAQLQRTAPEVLAKVASTHGVAGIDETRVRELAPAEVALVDEAKNYSAAMTFRWVAIVPTVLAVIFTLMFLAFRARGGYRSLHIHEDRAGARAH